jgi:hypothetical protein
MTLNMTNTIQEKFNSLLKDINANNGNSSINIQHQTTGEVKLTNAKLNEFRTKLFRIYDKKFRMENHKKIFRVT